MGNNARNTSNSNPDNNSELEYRILTLKELRVTTRQIFLRSMKEQTWLEDLRRTGYADAVKNHSAEIDAMTHDDKEYNRVAANENMRDAKEKIAKQCNFGAMLAFLTIVKKRVILLMMPIILVSLIFISPRARIFTLIAAVAVILLSYVAQWICYRISAWQLESAYYDYGFAEAIAEMSDYKEIFAKPDLSKPI